MHLPIFSQLSLVQIVEAIIGVASLAGLIILANVLQQLYKRPNEPPVVFHYVPIIGSAIAYGMNPFNFFFECQKKYGDVFTFVLLGRKVTVYLGSKGNRFILHGKTKDVNAEEIYSSMTTPVFGKDVAYDVPNAKFMEQKKLIMSGLTPKALRSYVPLMESEIQTLIDTGPDFPGTSGTIQVRSVMSHITLCTASRTLQGKEVRERLDSNFISMFDALDEGLKPINFIIPWLPLPHKLRRDAANRNLTAMYLSIIRARRARMQQQDPNDHLQSREEDMIWTLMSSTYKDGTPVTDIQTAHIMIALLIAGQDSSSVTSAWVMLHLAASPSLVESLYLEQLTQIGPPGTPLTYDSLKNLTLLTHVIRETLRLHSPVHSILRKVKNPLPIAHTPYIIPPSRILLATPATMQQSDDEFSEASTWDPKRWERIAERDEEKEKVDYGYGLVATGVDSNYLPFGAGQHRCIGEQFATLQLEVLVSVMVRNFRVGGKRGGGGGVVESDYSRLFSPPKEPAFMHWERRKGPSSM